MSDTNATTTGIAAALAAIVAAFVWLVKRKQNGNGHEKESQSERIAKNIALIEHEDIDLPKNWRRFVDERIAHQLNNRRAVLFAVVGLLERGHHERALTMLREEAEDLKP